ncbi:MAG: transporter [Ignavibacteriales bacterium]|nr:transporter [Ignavibacteriales bacterium]
MRKVFPIPVFVFLLTHMTEAQIPFLLTQGATPKGKGKIGAGVGFEYLEKNQSPAPDNPRSLLRFFMATLRHGVAENVDYDLTWRGGLFANHANGRRDFDWGDLSIWTKIALLREGRAWLGLALQSGIKLPNTRYSPSKLGSNQMDFHSRVLISKGLGGAELRGNLGFSILGDPTNTGSQDDVYSLSFAGLHPVSGRGRLFVEFLGQTGYQDHDEKLISRFGAIVEAEVITWTVYGTIRLAGNNRDFATAFEHSENWSVGIFFQRSFSATLWDQEEEQRTRP